MRRAIVGILASIFIAACSGNDGDGVTVDRCESGCEATVAAGCTGGPASQAACVADCRELQQSGPCTAAFSNFQACADGKAVTCSPTGLPIVVGCESQQAAFVGCVNTPR